jgi:DNA-binding transcriptional MocR family regulator
VAVSLDKLGRCLASAARHLDPLSTVTDLPPGNDELRRQLSLRYLAQGARVSPQEIVITSGAMEGSTCACRRSPGRAT